MRKKSHGPPHEEHADESWLLPYSDMMTLLLALFIVMFAVSSVDQAKYNAVMESLYTAFGGTTDVGSPTALPYPTAGLPSQSALDELVGGGQGQALSNLYLSLNDYVESNGLSDSIAVEYRGDDVLVVLKNDVFFDSGSAELSPEMQNEAQRLAQLIQENQNPASPFDVIVAGHTDNVPINNAQFPSNWHLSAMRALNFMMAMMEDSNLDPTHFSSRGYGEFEPVASNDTAEGRQKNRRVELLISEKEMQDPGPAAPGDAGASADGSTPAAASGPADGSGATADGSQAASASSGG